MTAPLHEALFELDFMNSIYTITPSILIASDFSTTSLTFNWNILNSKAKDDGPDHTQRHFHIAIHNFFGWENTTTN